MLSRSTAVAAALALTALTVFPDPVDASPWTVPEDQTVLDVAYDFQFATHEFIPDGTFQRFPVDGRFVSNTLRIGARYGISERLEIGALANFKSVSYTADPVILELPEEVTLQSARESIVDFNDNEFGAGDVLIGGRYNFVKKAFAAANELQLKLPTGYRTPQGTFDQQTGAVADDVTLGDGQADLEDAILLGLFIPQSRTFARLDAGFRLRFGGPGHQVFGTAKLGQFIGKNVLLFAGVNGAYTVTEGEVIGTTFVATEFDLTADELAAGQNVEPVDLRLDKDWLQAEGGVLLVVARGVEVQAAYQRIVVGRNIPAINTFSVGTTVKVDAGGSP